MALQQNEVLDVLIIGAGFSGICIGKLLLDADISAFLIFDKAPKAGGTWYWNSYPGAACDVLSHFYCYSFEPNPDWSRKYSPWNEIQAYADHCARKYGLRPHMEFNKEVGRSRFDDETGLWEVQFTDGTSHWARHVVDGAGALHVPVIPEFEGAEAFEGESWHSSLWRHDVDLAGKKVAVIGSAASALQIMPEIAKTASRVTVFQRTANYVIPRHDRRYLGLEKWCFRHLPLYSKLYRLLLFFRYELLAFPLVKTTAMNLQRRFALAQFRRLMKRSIKDPELRKALTPDYPLGCKRVLISDNFFEAFTRDNVELVTTAIKRFQANGIEMADGSVHKADIIVYATGFDTQGHHTEQRVTGPGGRTLGEAWSEAPIAYEGCMVAGFPNYHFTTGPNTLVGTTSVIFMIEQSARLIIECIRTAGRDLLIAPRQEAMQQYDREIQAALEKSVWATSCSSWYKRDDGRITVLYPYNAQAFRRSHLKMRQEDFELRPRSAD